MQPHFQILTHTDGNWMQPFAGLHEGFQFAASSPAVMVGVGGGTGGVSSWHHYAESWNAGDGTRKMYVDGVLKVRPAQPARLFISPRTLGPSTAHGRVGLHKRVLSRLRAYRWQHTSTVGAGTTWLDKQPYIIVGMTCYPAK
eukprot:2515316-Prymnesium_polylepis.1